MDNYYLPHYLNEPSRFLIFCLDDALVFFVPLILGLLFGHFITTTVVAFVGLTFYKAFKGKRQFEYLIILAYWYLPELSICQSLAKMRSHYFIG